MGIPLPLGSGGVDMAEIRHIFIPGGLVAMSSLKRFMEREYSFLQAAETEEGRADLESLPG